jgi:hypothetical protein
MQSSENLKADLLSALGTAREKNEYGTRWQEWQDFFWQHRGRGIRRHPNPNADAGFNEFLACLSGLMNLLNPSPVPFYRPQDFAASGAISTRQFLSNLDLTRIGRYFDSLAFLEMHKAAFKSRYAHADWVETCLNELWEILNAEKTNWYANYCDQDRGTERNRMAFLWPVLHYLARREELALLPVNDAVDDAFRVLRIHYVRYRNFERSVAGLAARIETLCIEGPFQVSGNDEENLKHALYQAVAPDLLRRYEELIRAIEDHKFNRDGRDVGNTNISHLLALPPDLPLAALQLVKDKFYELFPPQQSHYETLQSVLLYYGPYHDRESPYYYFNFNFGNWKKTIRGLDSQEAGQFKAFPRFLADFLLFPGTLAQFLQGKRATSPSLAQAPADHQKVLYYQQLVGNEIWRYGNYIAYSNGDYCGLPLWRETDDDASFPGSRVLYNTRGDLRGYRQQSLQSLLPTTAS